MEMTSRVTGQSIDPEDPWAIAQTNGYDIDKFYIRSTDGRGHSENVQAKLSPAMIGELNELIHTRELPYRTVQDFIRDACVHRARYISELVKTGKAAELSFGKLVAAEAKLTQIEQRAERRRLGQRVLDATAVEFKELIDAGKRSDAWDLVEEFCELADEWADETVYRHMSQAVENWRMALKQQTVGSGQLRRVQ